MKSNIDYTLYLVTDRDVLKGRDLCEAIEASIKGGVTLVQLREKDISSLDFYNLAVAVKKITDKYNVPLIINDRIDIALAVDAAGVHVGQSDIPANVARKIIGEYKILGISAATLEEAKLAEAEGADYLGIGAVFPTDTKKDARSVSIELLGEIKKSLTVPVVGIGGISQNNAELLKESKIDGIAVVSAILGKEDIEQAAKDMLMKFK
ncbi:thiamine phosphate synthase [Clostridium intestinale]|uniref:Thiamine-phosphate synthase n=1 Tax=Clostridium intestinale DSM 6191 TaxID=1121320 RepID=A0A1M5XW82_9CLOT|nr:thiamine phosphate synthase [Clostridium intestinale]SHI04095.1 thiamine-phosphate pyrophosphorylase [Clostridium intestinale DSM 6191]